MSASAKKIYRPETRLVQSGTLRSPFGETSEALFLTRRGRYAEAIPLLTRALAADPHYDLALRLRFLAYSAAGKPADALKDVKELVELHPTDAPLLAARGLTLMALRPCTHFIFWPAAA